MTILMTGDSITDCSRDRSDLRSLGEGYAALVAADLAHERVINTGIGGNRVVDLQARWEEDVLAHAPTVLSVMIGINDTWRRYDSDDPTSAQAYEAGYRALLTRTTAAGVARIILIEPFLLPVREEQWAWREDLDPKIQVVRRLAAEFGTEYLATDGPLTQTAARTAPDFLAHDGVHLTPVGHRLLADLWLDNYRR
ncbi:SGNH/GDSL hydrolase family protein [Ruania halotolerans]|uniref:SGNH/GDSL hydrolase family protein n=1 Tax=Ruania halotolerans TaxID=2897773 RepID=UPI001E28D68D|nr:SGNH/GDSL hydrolase family protein [Ruania halotolerans]UFU05911.1 SGNH/GDSL hydrolase family protein [Ruania halotolerans]